MKLKWDAYIQEFTQTEIMFFIYVTSIQTEVSKLVGTTIKCSVNCNNIKVCSSCDMMNVLV